MKTDRPLSKAKMSLSLKRSTRVYFLMMFMTLTAKVLAQNTDNLNQDAEQRKAKLRALLGRPLLSSALPQSNARKILTSLSQDNVSSTTQTSTSTSSDILNENSQTISTISNQKEEETLLEFLESRKNKSVNQTILKVSNPTPKELRNFVNKCHFEGSSGTLNCKDGLDFFDVGLSYKQTIRSIREQNKNDENAVELSSIDIFSCNIPIMFSFDRNNSSLTQNDQSVAVRSPENVKTIAIVNSGVENIEDGAFDSFSQTLIQLDLSNNKLDRIPSAILRLRHLIDLNLSGNQISQLPILSPNLVETGGSFRNLVRLSSLNLGNNRLGVENKKFSSLPLNSLNELKPLAKTLDRLNLKSNGFTSLPGFLQGNTTFDKLRSVDVSHNPIDELPVESFNNLPELTELNIEHCRLQTLHLNDKTARNVNILLMEGNPLKCDCDSRWLWNMIHFNGKMSSKVKGSMKLKGWNLPRCSTPFSVKNNKLSSLKEQDFCHLATKPTLLDGNESFKLLKKKEQFTRVPRFFRVSPADELSFPKDTFTSLSVDKVEAVPINAKNGKMSKDIDIKISWSVSKSFYYTDYDWAIIYRKIGDSKNPNMFYKTPYSLNSHMKVELGLKENWSPKSENLTGSVKTMQDTFYEICLSVVDEEAILYYLHTNHCKEVRTPKLDEPQKLGLFELKPKAETNTRAHDAIPSYRDEISTTNVSVTSNSESITVSWQVLFNEDVKVSNALTDTLKHGKDKMLKSSNEVISLIRKISLRPFSSENSTKLFVLEDFNRTQWKEKNEAPIASRYYTLSNLQPNTPYVVCFETLPPQEHKINVPLEVEARKSGKSLRSWHESGVNNDMTDSVCMETSTINLNITASVVDFPVTEVAAATAVSTTTTAFVIAIICCCCPTSCCRRKKGNSKGKNVEDRTEEDVESSPSKDENENKLDSYEVKKLRAHLRKHSSPERSVHSSSTGGVGTTSYVEQELLKSDCNRSSTTSDSEIRKLSHSKFHERYPAANHCPQHNGNNPSSIMKSSAESGNSGPSLKFWKSCLSSSERNMNTTGESRAESNERHRVQIATISSSSACSEINIEESEIENEDDVQLEETERGIQIKENNATEVYDGEPTYERSNEEIIVEEPPIVAQNINMITSNSFHNDMPHTTHSLPRVKMRKSNNHHSNPKNVESRGTQVKTSNNVKHSSANADLTSEVDCNGQCCNEHSTMKYPNYYTLPHPGSLQPPQNIAPHLLDHPKGGCNQVMSRPLPPPRFLPNGTILPMYDSRREPPSGVHLHQGHHRVRGVTLDPANFGPGSYNTLPNYQFYKRPVPMEYYTPPQPDYYRVLRHGELNGQIHPSSHHPSRFLNNLDYSAQTLGRTKKEAKAMGSFVRNGNNNYHTALMQSQHMHPHQHQMNQQQFGEKLMRASKLKKFLLKHNIAPHSNQNPHQNSNEQFKMYTWSPYNTNGAIDSTLPQSHCGQHPNNTSVGMPSSSSVYVHPQQMEPFVPVHHPHPATQQTIPAQSLGLTKSTISPGPASSDGKGQIKRGNRNINELRF